MMIEELAKHWNISLKEAKSKLINLNIETVGKGEVVEEMNPLPGSRVKEGSSVKLLLN